MKSGDCMPFARLTVSLAYMTTGNSKISHRTHCRKDMLALQHVLLLSIHSLQDFLRRPSVVHNVAEGPPQLDCCGDGSVHVAFVSE